MIKLIILILLLLYMFFRLGSYLQLKKRRSSFKTKYNDLVEKVNKLQHSVFILQININRHTEHIETLSNKITAFELLKKEIKNELRKKS